MQGLLWWHTSLGLEDRLNSSPNMISLSFKKYGEQISQKQAFGIFGRLKLNSVLYDFKWAPRSLLHLWLGRYLFLFIAVLFISILIPRPRIHALVFSPAEKMPDRRHSFVRHFCWYSLAWSGNEIRHWCTLSTRVGSLWVLSIRIWTRLLFQLVYLLPLLEQEAQGCMARIQLWQEEKPASSL